MSTNSTPNLNDCRAAGAGAILRGEHDFHSLTTDDAGTMRDLSIGVDRDGDILRIRVAADRFPQHLVRRVASVVRAVGTGSRPLGWVRRLFGAAPLDGPDGVPTAAPEPLVLTGVSYPDLSFGRNPEAAASAAGVFGDWRRGARVHARAAGHLASIGNLPGSDGP